MPSLPAQPRNSSPKVFEAAALMASGVSGRQIEAAYDEPVLEAADKLRGVGIQEFCELACGQQLPRFRRDATGWLQAAFSTAALGALTCDTLRLGAPTAVNGSGRIKMGDRVHSLNYITKGNSANTNNAMDLKGCTILPSQIIDGEYITVTSAGANIHGGIVRSLNSAGIIHLWGPEDGSHSNSIDVVAEGSNASPNGAQMVMGCAA